MSQMFQSVNAGSENVDRMRIPALLGLTALALLFFVWPIPHTTAPRNTLAFFCLLLFGWLVAKSRGPALFSGLRVPMTIYLLLTGWLFLVAVFVSQETLWSLKEIKAEWLKSTLTMILGVLVGSASRAGPTLSPARVFFVLSAVLVVHVSYIDASAVVAWIETGRFPIRMSGLMEHCTYANHVTNVLLVFLLTETFSRLVWRHTVLPLSNPILAALVIATLASSLFETTRNGFVELSVITATALGLYWREHRGRFTRRRVPVYLLAIVGIATVFFYQGFRHDLRWNSFLETIPIALDTETHKAWLDNSRYPLPKLSDGSEVNHSNYMRIAWLKEGLKAVAEHPLGVGYGRNAFGHAMEAKYGARAGGTSHSSLLDITIGAGIPGALLWCAFLVSVAFHAFGSYRAEKNYFALALFLLTIGYGVRMVLDGTARDHILEQFLFLTGLLATWIVRTPAVAGTARA